MKYKVVASLMNISFEFFDFPLENSVFPIDLSEHFSAISLITPFELYHVEESHNIN